MELGKLPQPFKEGEATARDGVKIYYHIYGVDEKDENGKPQSNYPQVIMIMGFACPGSSWMPQLEDLLQPNVGSSVLPMQICVMDNRGIGKSSAPSRNEFYSTDIMADDVLAVTDEIGWSQFHVVGFSMGGMIASKLAASNPTRVRSLSLLSVTGGRWQSLPRTWRAFKYAVKTLLAQTPEDKAKMDLKFHYSKSTLKEKIGRDGRQRQEYLYEEYLEMHQREQPSADGCQGQLMACWKHKLSKKDIERIATGDFPVIVIHGRHDLVAQKKFGRRIAMSLGAQFVEVEGAHFITRECGTEVSKHLQLIIHNPTTAYQRSQHLDRDLFRRGNAKVTDHDMATTCKLQSDWMEHNNSSHPSVNGFAS